MRILIIIILLPVALYAATIGYLRYEVKNKAEKIVKSASPFATITYDSIYTSWSGDTVGLNDITIEPVMTQDVFHIGQVHLHAPHIGYFLDMNSSKNMVKPGDMPEKLGIKVSRLQFDLDSQLFSMIEQMQQQQAAIQRRGSSGADFSLIQAMGCGDKEGFTTADYQQMGIGTVTMDVNFEVKNNKERDRLTAIMKLSADGLGSGTIETGLDGISTMAPNSYSGRIPDTTITYRDDGYYAMRNAYCADLNNGTAEEYVDNNVAALSNAIGSPLPEKAVSAYRQFMLNGGKLQASIKPNPNVPATNLQLYAPEDIIQMLGMDLTIRGERVDLSTINWASAKKPDNIQNETDKPALTSPPQARPRPNVRNKTPSQTRQPTFHTVSVEQLNKHVGRNTRITMQDGRVREGILDTVNDWRVRLEVRSPRGSMSFPIKIAEISKVRVQY